MKRIFSLPLLLGALVCFAVFARPATANAAMTQREYIKWIVQLAGDRGSFTSFATDEDYIKWAKKQKMDPKETQKGWNLDGALTQEVLAETLAQFFDLGKPKKGSDYVRLLLREGISLPDIAEISREDFAVLIDKIGMQGLAWTDVKWSKSHSPAKPSKKPTKPPKPPKPPKVPTPKKG